jgi:hypothetical protein
LLELPPSRFEDVMPSTNSGLTRHHRKPRSLGGTATKTNISRLPPKKHTAWHILFSNLPAEKIAEEINRLYGDPDYEFIAIRKEELCESSRLLSGSSSRSR